MISIFRRGKPLASREDIRWRKVQEQEEKLYAHWGLGWRDDKASYRERLKRLCRFLLDLEPEGGDDETKRSDLQKLLFAIESRRKHPHGKREEYIRRLEDLQTALADLQRRGDEAKPESAEEYLVRLKKWNVSAALQPELAGTPQENEQRCKNVEKSLAVLGALPDPLRLVENPCDALANLGDLLDELEADATQAARVTEARAHWRKYADDCIADWEWAYLQVLVRLAQECLKEKPDSEQRCRRATKAETCLLEAVDKLEKRGFLQPRTQGLYALLAGTCLTRAKAAGTERQDRFRLLQRSLCFARRAVEIEPESARERLVLLEVLTTLGDYEEMKVEAEVALNLDAGSETLKTIGASFWDRATSVRGRGMRRRVLREAAIFFQEALEQVESGTFNESAPLEQVEAHGWAHYWLGRFQCERGKHDEATAHLRIAGELGFKPIESRVELAWAHLLARDFRKAEQAFREALEEAGLWGKDKATIARAPGEERTITELKFDAYLGWALLSAEWNPNQVKGHLERAKTCLRSIARSDKEDLKAALKEARGRACLAKGDLETGVKELEKAVQLSAHSGAYCYLGLANLRLAQANSHRLPAALNRAREAYRLARVNDVRGRNRREIWELRRQLQKIDNPAGPPSRKALVPPSTHPAARSPQAEAPPPKTSQ